MNLKGRAVKLPRRGPAANLKCRAEAGGRERRKFGLGKVRQAALVCERLGVFRFAGVVPSDLVDWKDWCEIQQLE